MRVALAVYINVSGLCRLPLEDCGNRTAPSQLSACGRAPSLEASLRRVMHNAMSSNICQEFTCAWGATRIRFINLSYIFCSYLLKVPRPFATCIWWTSQLSVSRIHCVVFVAVCFRLCITSCHPFVSVKGLCTSISWISRKWWRT